MPTREIVAEGVRMAVQLAQDAGASREPSTRYFEPTLIVRDSTAPPGGMARLSVGAVEVVPVAPGDVPAKAELMPWTTAVGFRAALGPGEVAFAIPVDPSQAVGGALAPGARVSVVAVANVSKTEDEASPASTSTILGTNLKILALRTSDGQPLIPAEAAPGGAAVPPRLGIVVVAIPAGRLESFASAMGTSTFYLALSEPGGAGVAG
jgi:Flp pilus assembly protein CpaB